MSSKEERLGIGARAWGCALGGWSQLVVRWREPAAVVC